jgi:hypothetical protein
MSTTTPAQSVLLKYRSNGLAKKRKKKEMSSTLMTTIEQKLGFCMCMHTSVRRQRIDEGKLSLYNERIRRRRRKKITRERKTSIVTVCVCYIDNIKRKISCYNQTRSLYILDMPLFSH